MIKLIDAQFIKSARSLQDSVPPDRAEVAFLGRSNVGKSTLLNRLTNRKHLAKSSSTPGKTQLINYFNIKFKYQNDKNEISHLYARFVDLPGFGYAKVSKSLKQEWNRHLTAYLEKRENLQIFIHLKDARHPLLEIDQNLERFLDQIKRPDQLIITVFTKTDKLKKRDLNKLKQLYPNACFISSLHNNGFDILQNNITEYLFGC